MEARIFRGVGVTTRLAGMVARRPLLAEGVVALALLLALVGALARLWQEG